MVTVDPKKVRFAAQIRDVRELRLIGCADATLLNRQLVHTPFEIPGGSGFAEITVAAVGLAWRGLRFNELTVSASVALRGSPKAQAGYLLLRAFNSNPLLAFCERTFFCTPYLSGEINLKVSEPCAMEARSGNARLFRAEMSKADLPAHAEDECWEGAVFLPPAESRRYFVAKLSGMARIRPFLESDRIEMTRDARHGVFALLSESGFTGREWRIRLDGFHARSKTYRYDPQATSR